jgi:hypothetical protein
MKIATLCKPYVRAAKAISIAMAREGPPQCSSLKIISSPGELIMSLATKKSIELPKELLEKFFDNPPLVGNESREEYDAFFLEIARALKPDDFIQWNNVREYTDISWELRRERRIKADIIKLKQREAQIPSSMAMLRVDLERQKMEPEFQSAFKKRDSKPEVKKDESKSLPEAYIIGHRDIDVIDTRIASYVYRRHAILREIQRYNESKARKREKAAPDIIDGDYSDAEE